MLTQNYFKMVAPCEDLPIFFVNKENSLSSAILGGLKYCAQNKGAWGFDVFFANNVNCIKTGATGAPLFYLSFWRGSGKYKNYFYAFGYSDKGCLRSTYLLPGRIKKDILKKHVTGDLEKIFDFVLANKKQIERLCY